MNPLTCPHLTCFSLTTTEHIAHLVLNRPKAMNTMHPTFWRELDEVLTHINKAADARVLVISSTGKHFSAGMALETFGGDTAMDDQSARGHLGHQAGDSLRARPFGGRCVEANGLAASCDLEQPAGARGRNSHEGKTPRVIYRAGSTQAF
jgi:hypothetical protein